MNLVFPEDEPADMRVPKALFNAVRVQVGVHIAVMIAVLGRPSQTGLFKSRGAEK